MDEQVEYIFYTTVVEIRECQRVIRGYKNTSGDATLETEELGWFILLEGSHERLFVGKEKPTLMKGDSVEVIIRRRPNAQI